MPGGGPVGRAKAEERVGLVGKNPKLSWGTGLRVSFEDSPHPQKKKHIKRVKIVYLLDN